LIFFDYSAKNDGVCSEALSCWRGLGEEKLNNSLLQNVFFFIAKKRIRKKHLF